MDQKNRDLMLGEMHSDIKNISRNVEKMNGKLEDTSKRSIKNEVKINRVWKITGGFFVALVIMIIGYVMNLK